MSEISQMLAKIIDHINPINFSRYDLEKCSCFVQAAMLEFDDAYYTKLSGGKQELDENQQFS